MSFSLALLQKALIGRHAKQDFPRLRLFFPESATAPRSETISAHTTTEKMQAIASTTAVRPQFATQRKTFNAKKVSARVFPRAPPGLIDEKFPRALKRGARFLCSVMPEN